MTQNDLQVNIKLLTHRQETIMRLIATGMTHAEIAQQLGIKQRTVKNTATSAIARSGAEHREQVIYALGLQDCAQAEKLNDEKDRND